MSDTTTQRGRTNLGPTFDVDWIDTPQRRYFNVDTDSVVPEVDPRATHVAASPIAPALLDSVAELVATLCERHAKYGPLNIANSPGGALNGITVRLHDKLARLAHAGATDFTDESVRDTLVDIAGYGVIGLLVVDGKWPA